MKENLTYGQILTAYELAGINETYFAAPVDRLKKNVEIRPLRKTVLGDEMEGATERSTGVTEQFAHKTEFPKRSIQQDAVFQEPSDSKNSNAESAKTLADLKSALNAFDGCYLKKTATNTVFGVGNPQSGLMLIGEAPGAEEDKQGIPFVGKSGQLLDRMLASIGISRDSNCYIANILPWRPPGNRTPSQAEVAACLPFIKRHIALVNPDIIVFLGAQALNALIPGNYAITRTRGKWFDYVIEETGKTVKTLATYHPAFLLRSPGQKKNAWLDMLALKKAIGLIRN